MNLVKKLFKISIQGIGIACIIFVLIGMIIDNVNKGTITFENWSFTKQVLGTIMIGIGFSAPSEIYNNDKLPFFIKFLFHMGIGCTIYLIIAFNVGWIPVAFGWQICFFFILLQLFIAFIIWFCFAHHYKKLAKNMNEKILLKNKEEKE